jgi:hypothetical protein
MCGWVASAAALVRGHGALASRTAARRHGQRLGFVFEIDDRRDSDLIFFFGMLLFTALSVVNPNRHTVYGTRGMATIGPGACCHVGLHQPLLRLHPTHTRIPKRSPSRGPAPGRLSWEADKPEATVTETSSVITVEICSNY